MHHHCGYTRDTMNYLNCFDEVLENMMTSMTGARLTDSISYNFIVQMLPHHQAAIEMSRNILFYTDIKSLQAIASRIITEQTVGITKMKDLLPECRGHLNPRKDVCLCQWHITRIMNTMFSDMRNACANNHINANYLREMIPHHKGAILIAENVLKFNIFQELRPLLENIIASQQNDIRQMQKLLCQI